MRITWVGMALLAMTVPASAHAFLDHAIPGAGATLAAAPKTTVLDFTEDLEPAFSGATVSDRTGHDVTSGPPSVSGREMRLGLNPLAPGPYRVTWHAVSVDSHRTEGSYTFTVQK